jgi:hypothetical protein
MSHRGGSLTYVNPWFFDLIPGEMKFVQTVLTSDECICFAIQAGNTIEGT